MFKHELNEFKKKMQNGNANFNKAASKKNRGRANSDFRLNYRHSFQAAITKPTKMSTIMKNVEDIISPIYKHLPNSISTSTPSTSKIPANHMPVNSQSQAANGVEDDLKFTAKPPIPTDTFRFMRASHSNENILHSKLKPKANASSSNVNSAGANNYLSEKITKNQGVVKIVQSYDEFPLDNLTNLKRSLSRHSTNETKISAIEELDKCIAEFDTQSEESLDKRPLFTSITNSKNNSIEIKSTGVSRRASASSSSSVFRLQHTTASTTETSTSKIFTVIKSFKNEVQIVNAKSNVPDATTTDINNNNNKVTVNVDSNNNVEKKEDAKNVVTTANGIVPPPPPPLPSSWFTLGNNSQTSRKFIISNE